MTIAQQPHDGVGVRRCPETAHDPERATSPLHHTRPSLGDQTSPWLERFRRCRLCYLRPLPSALREPGRRELDDYSYSALPRLPALPHQVLKGVHALSYASPSERVPEGAQPRQDGAGGRGQEDGDVRRRLLLLSGRVLTFSLRVLVAGR